MKRKPVVLVVDDTRSVAETLAMLLKESGYNAIAAYSSKAALDVVTGVAADVTIVDINLPDGIDGVKTAVEIRKRLPNCKIVLISGDAESSEILDRAKKEGIEFPVLAKPIPPEELLGTLQNLLKTCSRH